MVCADVLAGSPVYLSGLAQVLTDADGITVIATPTSFDDAPHPLADVLVADADALSYKDCLVRVDEMSGHTPVLVVNSATASGADNWLAAGASGALCRREPDDRIVWALRSIASGARLLACSCPAALLATDAGLWDLPCRKLRALMHTAAACPEDVKRDWIARLGGERLYEMYGSTQMIGVAVCDGTQWLQRPGTVGRPFMTQVRILDQDRRCRAPGHHGEVTMRSAATRRLPTALAASLRRHASGFYGVGGRATPPRRAPRSAFRTDDQAVSAFLLEPRG